MKLDLLSKCIQNENEKCKKCMLIEITRSPFPKIEKNSSTSELIHSEECNLHATPYLGGN